VVAGDVRHVEPARHRDRLIRENGVGYAQVVVGTIEIPRHVLGLLRRHGLTCKFCIGGINACPAVFPGGLWFSRRMRTINYKMFE